jgi:3-oxoacyl-[acyl-carrier-protein] synthase II
MSQHQVVVTGLGPVTPIGVGAAAFHEGQLACRSGIRTISRFDPTDLPVRIAGEVDLPAAFALDGRAAAATDRCTHLAAAAAHLAVLDSGLDLGSEDPCRIGVVLGTGIGGVSTWERTSRVAHDQGSGRVGPRFIPMAMPNNAASWIATHYGFTGPSTAVVTACASGAEAVAVAYLMIAAGVADVVLTGGAEAPITPIVVTGFASMRALSRRNDEPQRASRPFSADREGFVLAEGAAILVLESAAHAAARGARVHARLAGVASTSDAFHITRPRPDGDGARRALTTAMTGAGLRPQDVSYLNAHGTGTHFNDAAEVVAVCAALGDAAAHVPVSSTKSLTGHSLGASGAIEAVASIQALTSGVIPATANLDQPDPALTLDFVPHEPRAAAVRAVLSSSFAFGGHNVVLAFTRA